MVDVDRDAFLASAKANPAMALGPAMAGITADAMFLGVVIGQFVYWKVFLERADRKMVKLLVYWITLGSIGSTMMIQAFAWSVFVLNYGDYLSVISGWWLKAICLEEIIVAMPIEVFYAHRAYSLWERSPYIKYGLGAILTGSICVGLTNIAVGPSDPIYVSTNWIFMSWAISLIVIDWSISGIISVALLKSKSGIAGSDRFVNRVVRFTAEAQLLPSIVAGATLIQRFIAPTSLVVLAAICAPKLWVITCLTVLNMREHLRAEMETLRELRQITFNDIPVDAERGLENTSAYIYSHNSDHKQLSTVNAISTIQKVPYQFRDDILKSSPPQLQYTIMDGLTRAVSSIPPGTVISDSQLAGESHEMTFHEMLQRGDCRGL